MDFKNGDIVEVENISDLERVFPQYDWNLVKNERGIIVSSYGSFVDIKFYKEIPIATPSNILTLETRILRLANLDFFPGQEVLIKWKIPDSRFGWISPMDTALGKTGVIRDRYNEYYSLDVEGFNACWWPPEALVAVSNSNSYKNIGLNLLTKLW